MSTNFVDGVEVSKCYSLNSQNYCFYSDSSVLSWNEARETFCARRHSTLPIITDEYVDNVFQQFVVSDSYSLIQNRSVWIAAHSRPVNNSASWHWIDGQTSGTVNIILSVNKRTDMQVYKLSNGPIFKTALASALTYQSLTWVRSTTGWVGLGWVRCSSPRNPPTSGLRASSAHPSIISRSAIDDALFNAARQRFSIVRCHELIAVPLNVVGNNETRRCGRRVASCSAKQQLWSAHLLSIVYHANKQTAHDRRRDTSTDTLPAFKGRYII